MSAPSIEPRLLKGFRDALPEEAAARRGMIEALVQVFERFGFAPLETPALEYAEILLGKYGADAEKLLYRFRDNGGRDVCLRYDLTVPLARVAAQYPDLPKPFKRWQVAPVWRAENTGRGRFREFLQCDADVVGSESLLSDAECVALGDAAMRALGVEARIRLSNRKVLTALGRAVGVEGDDRLAAVFRTIDKAAAQGLDRVRELLASEAGLGAAEVERIAAFLSLSGSNDEMLRRLVETLGGPAEEAAADLGAVLGYARGLGVADDRVSIDFGIARGLDYYTGTVYETFLEGLPGFGSVMSGGRYDGLITRFLGRPVPAVGISVGVDRLLAGLRELGKAPGGARRRLSSVVCCDETCLAECLALVARLRAAGLPAEAAFEAEKGFALKRQMKAADRRGAAFALVLGPKERAAGAVAVRSMETGEQRDVPAADVVRFLQDAAEGRA